MKRYLSAGVMTFAMVLAPMSTAFANETIGTGSGDQNVQKPSDAGNSNNNDEKRYIDPCLLSAYQKREPAMRAVHDAFQKTMQEIRTKMQADREAAKLITDETQRQDAMDAAEDASALARFNAEKTQRLAMRVVTRAFRADAKACKDQQAARQACVKDASRTFETSMRQIQDTFKSSTDAAKTKFESDREAARNILNEDEHQTALNGAEDAMYTAKHAAETTAREARRALIKQMQDAKKACQPQTTATVNQ